MPTRASAAIALASAMTEIEVGEGLTLRVDARSPLAFLAELSRHELLRRVGGELGKALARSSLLSDWIEHAVDRRDLVAVVDGDEAFAAFVSFCRSAGAPPAGRLSHADFTRAMTLAGFAGAQDRQGRQTFRGCRLRAHAFMPLAPLERATAREQLEEFLSLACEAADAERVRSLALHAEYQAWATRSGRPPLSIKPFGAAMKALGYVKLTSNGTWWLRLRLRTVGNSGVETGQNRGGSGCGEKPNLFGMIDA